MGPTTPATGEPEIGEYIGGCRIERLIGRGGMGAVYEAHQVSLDRRVAVKVIKPEKMTQEAMQARFIREARVAAKLNHPNIVQVFDVGQEGQTNFIIMEYVEGITFKEVLRREPKLPVARLAQLAAQIANGLAAAHDQLVVHRDIKPENILITLGGTAKITDFGAASFLIEAQSSKSIVGTPAFVAPETLLREPMDGRADVYALGLILYTAAAGAYPFQYRDKKQVLAAQIHKKPEPLSKVRPAFPPLFAELIHRMCAKPRQERPSAAEVLAVLESHREWEKIEDEEAPKQSEASALAPDFKDSPAPSPPQWAPPPTPVPRPDVGGRKSILDAPLIRDTASAKSRPKAEPEKKSALLPPGQLSSDNPAVKDLLAQADLLFTKKDFQQAEECFRIALRLEPRNRGALLGLARMYTEQLRYKEAVYELYLALASGKVTARGILEMPEFESLKVNEGFRSVIGQFWA